MRNDAPPPPPRAFRLGALDSSTVFLLMFGGIWAFVGLLISIVFTVAGGPFWDDLALDRRGVAATGIPVAITPTSARVNGHTVLRVEYQFTDATGTPRRGASGTTDQRLLARAQQMQPLDVEYDPARPALSRVRGQRASFFGLFVLFPFAFFVVGAPLFLAGVRRAARQRAIYVGGHAVLATVTAVTATSMRVNGRRLLRVAYAFDTPIGGATGSTTSRAAPPVGGRLWVLHDPRDPKINVAY